MRAAHSLVRLSLSLSFFLFASSLALCQVGNVTDTEATPIPGAGHNYMGMLNETVSPATGTLSVRIQVPMPTGRGLTLPFAFAYDSFSSVQGSSRPPMKSYWRSYCLYS